MSAERAHFSRRAHSPDGARWAGGPGYRRCASAAFAALACVSLGHAHEAAAPLAEEVEVIGRAQNLIGLTFSASEGVIGSVDLAVRPLLRSGELLEVVPGAAVTQHSGTGKANQYFLRGFNLDHGTDFAGFLDGVPLNQPTHGHGQGYLDLNPIIPEFVERIAFAKGPYHADVGDFSSAGYARYSYKHRVERPFASFTGGEFGFLRAVAGASTEAVGGTLLAGIEAQRYDGPWELDEDADKLNVLLKYSNGGPAYVPDITFTVYDAEWSSTDQVPERAIDRGIIDRLGNIDPTLGGSTTRYSANLEFGEGAGNGFRANAYVVYSDFELFSNFTYFLDDPVNGDQITQEDERVTVGFSSAYRGDYSLSEFPARWEAGVQLRHDSIDAVALRRSRARRPISTVREDVVDQTSLGFFATTEIEFATFWRGEFGVRADQFWFDVDSGLAANSGGENDILLSPKASLVFGPWHDTEFFLNAGLGFHSNDARGTVTRVDPASGDPAAPVDPLVRSTGAETGVRFRFNDRLNSTLSVWYLELDSELVFVGDAGTTEASGESRRYGVEWGNFFRATDWLTLDLDVALTESEFVDGADDAIPNSVGRVVTAGAVVDLPSGLFGTLRVRHFGDSPLNEDGSVEAEATTVVNARAGFRFSDRLEVMLDVFNLLDSEDPDISYFFASCLPSDPSALCGAGLAERTGVEDVHVHPVEPRSIRATLRYMF